MSRVCVMLTLLLSPLLASAAPRFDANKVERTRRVLGTLGMATDSPVALDAKLSSRGLIRRQDITINPSKIRNRSALVNTMAHEMKHARDHKIIDALLEKNAAALGEETRLENAMRGGKNETLAAEYDRVYNGFAERARRIDRLSTSDVVETRANRAGAFALGRLGRSLGTEHLTLPDNKAYAHREHLLRANTTGFVLGAKKAMRSAAAFATLTDKERHNARQRINAYLRGYREFLESQAANQYSAQPDPVYDAPALAVRKAGRRAQTTDRLPNDTALASAGRVDAWLGLSPLARQPELLRAK